MASEDKVRMLRARATALRTRALALANAFTAPALRERAGSLVLRIDDELEWLAEVGRDDEIPPLSDFLPETTARIAELVDLLGREGPQATLASRTAAWSPPDSH
jgi:hypothetical protein